MASPLSPACDQYLGTEVSNDNMHLLKKMGSATAASGAVGLYHVENLTPDAKEKGRNGLLKEGYQTYVYDDAEQERVLSAISRLNGKDALKIVTVALIGCPHNTYKEILDWGTKVTEADREERPENGRHPDQAVLLVRGAGPSRQRGAGAGRQDDGG